MKRNGKIALAALVGAAFGALVARRRGTVSEPIATADQRADELRRKLAQARAARAEEDDFEAAGMSAETVVEDETRPAPGAPAPESVDSPEAPAAEEPAPDELPEGPAPAAERPKPPTRPGAADRPPSDEFEAMRRRIHEEGRAAAEEMRRSGEPPAER